MIMWGRTKAHWLLFGKAFSRRVNLPFLLWASELHPRYALFSSLCLTSFQKQSSGQCHYISISLPFTKARAEASRVYAQEVS